MMIKVDVEYKGLQLSSIQEEQPQNDGERKETKMTRELERKHRVHRRFQSVDSVDI